MRKVPRGYVLCDGSCQCHCQPRQWPPAAVARGARTVSLRVGETELTLTLPRGVVAQLVAQLLGDRRPAPSHLADRLTPERLAVLIAAAAAERGDPVPVFEQIAAGG